MQAMGSLITARIINDASAVSGNTVSRIKLIIVFYAFSECLIFLVIRLLSCPQALSGWHLSWVHQYVLVTVSVVGMFSHLRLGKVWDCTKLSICVKLWQCDMHINFNIIFWKIWVKLVFNWSRYFPQPLDVIGGQRLQKHHLKKRKRKKKSFFRKNNNNKKRPNNTTWWCSFWCCLVNCEKPPLDIVISCLGLETQCATLSKLLPFSGTSRPPPQRPFNPALVTNEWAWPIEQECVAAGGCVWCPGHIVAGHIGIDQMSGSPDGLLCCLLWAWMVMSHQQDSTASLL